MGADGSPPSHGHLLLKILQSLMKRADLPSETGQEPSGLILVLEGQNGRSTAGRCRTPHEVEGAMGRMRTSADEVGSHGRSNVFLMPEMGREAAMRTTGIDQ